MGKTYFGSGRHQLKNLQFSRFRVSQVECSKILEDLSTKGKLWASSFTTGIRTQSLLKSLKHVFTWFLAVLSPETKEKYRHFVMSVTKFVPRVVPLCLG